MLRIETKQVADDRGRIDSMENKKKPAFLVTVYLEGMDREVWFRVHAKNGACAARQVDRMFECGLMRDEMRAAFDDALARREMTHWSLHHGLNRVTTVTEFDVASRP
jgi:hypothetical protein